MADVNTMVDTALRSPALLAAILLVAPTLVWILWRLMFGRPARMPESTVGYLWVCQRCHSANPPAEAACYGCGNRMDGFETIKLIDGVTGAVIESVPGGTPVITSLPTAPSAPPASVAVVPGTTGGAIEAGASTAGSPANAMASSHVPPSRPMAAVGARRPHEVVRNGPE